MSYSGQNHSNNSGQLYMSHLEPYMDDQFLFRAFLNFGEVPKYIKCINKYQDGSGYCFISFPNDKSALACMHKCNGKIVPNSNPPVRFRISHGTSRSAGSTPDREYTLWVGELTSEVDDYQLYKAFSSKYHSIRSAKVVVDSNGHSRGYGFIKFTNEDELHHCLSHMSGYIGLGSRPIRVGTALPKGYRGPSPSSLSTPDQNSRSSSRPESSFWKNYAGWSQKYYDPVAMAQHTIQMNSALFGGLKSGSSRFNDLELIDHSLTFDVKLSNRELLERDHCFWDALEASKWLPTEKLDELK